MMSAMSMGLMLFGQYIQTPRKFHSPVDPPEDVTEVDSSIGGPVIFPAIQVTILPLRGEKGYA